MLREGDELLPRLTLELRLALLTVDEEREGEELLRVTLCELLLTEEVLLREVEASLRVQVLLLRLTDAELARELPEVAVLRLTVAEVEREPVPAVAEREAVEVPAEAEREL